MKNTGIIIVIFLFCAASCNTGKKDAFFEIKIAKTVPANFINTADTFLSKKEDTMFFKNHFFTGFVYTLYANADTASLQSYFNGVEEGMQKKWYPGKQLAEERFYINGKKEGTHKGWWPTGKP
jgi:antitoxin component YwqK of YwqJK toxin-antitoxin module